MKFILSLFSILFIFSNSFAQDFKGKAIYQSQTKLDIQLDSTQIPKDRMADIKEMMKKQLEKRFELTFNKTEAIYKEEDKLEQPGQGGFRFNISQGVLYKNIKDKRYSRQIESFSKEFLVKDSLPKYEWVMEGDSKMIGEYLCFKATTTKEVPNMKRFGPPRPPKEGEKNTKDESESKTDEPKTKIINVTAWYTTEIPINNGPSDYYGLPGLILEVNEENTNYLCVELTLNAKDATQITEPDKGKVVTQKEFDKMMEDKIKEMQEMYGGPERKGEGGGGHRMIIRM